MREALLNSPFHLKNLSHELIPIDEEELFISGIDGNEQVEHDTGEVVWYGLSNYSYQLKKKKGLKQGRKKKWQQKKKKH